MKKPSVYCLGILSLFLAVSCGPKDSESSVPAPETVLPEVERTVKLSAEVTEDSLRVRVSPYLDADIVGHLMKGNTVLIESRTSWSESIAGFNSPWFFVRADGYSGWTYGGFLDFGTFSPREVPVDPGILPPDGAGGGDDSADSGKNSGGSGAKLLDPEVLPEILLPVFGMENESGYVNPGDGIISYDESREKLIIGFSELSENGLKDFRDGNSGTDELRIVAGSPGATAYERTYTREECVFLSAADSDSSADSSVDAVLVDFFRLAVLESGSWEIYAFPGDSNWPAAVGIIEITPAELSLVSSSDPDPLRDSPRGRYNHGDTVYIFGRSSPDPGHLQFALYHESDEYREGEILLRPSAALELNTDSKGFWSAHLLLDDSMPAGRYWGAVGDPIKGAENLKLFITGILYGNIS